MPCQLKYCYLCRNDHYVKQSEFVILSQKTGQKFFSQETIEIRILPQSLAYWRENGNYSRLILTWEDCGQCTLTHSVLAVCPIKPVHLKIN